MIVGLIAPEEVSFEYDNNVFENNESRKKVRRIYVVKDGLKKVFKTSFPAAVAFITKKNVSLDEVLRT